MVRQPSLGDIICLLIVAAAVIYLLTGTITLVGLVVTVVIVVLLIWLVRWALGTSA